MAISRALISVSDKTGVVEFAQKISEKGVEILSTGGTAKALKEAGVSVKDVSDYRTVKKEMEEEEIQDAWWNK